MSIYFFILLFASLAFPAHAADSCVWGSFEAPIPGLENMNICELISQGAPFTTYVSIVVTFMTAIIVIIGLIMIIVGGYIYMTAAGSAERVGTAKTMIASALIGIVLALAAVAILNIIGPQFTTSTI